MGLTAVVEPRKQPTTRTDHYPSYEIIEHKNSLAVAVPFNDQDKSRVWVRMGDEIIRISYNSKFFADLLDVPLDKMVMLRRQPTLWIVEKNDLGHIIAEYEAAVVATE